MLRSHHHQLQNASCPCLKCRHRPTAVIIEDDPDTRELVALVLHRSGFACQVTGSGLEGVEMVRWHRPDLVVVDAGLHDINGFEVNRQLRTFSTTHILMLSAWCRNEDRRRGFETGADEYLTKPFHPADLASRALSLNHGSARERPCPGPRESRTATPEPGMSR